MRNGIISVRLGPDYQMMVEKLRTPGESDSDFVRRAIDALALLDCDFLEFIEEELEKDDCGV